MKLITFLLIVLLFPMAGFGQEVKYLTMEDVEISSRDRAFYYQKKKEPKKRNAKNGWITVKEYYVFNDQLKREAKYLGIDPSLLTGEYSEYYITGQLKARGAYHKGDRMEGFETFYFNGQVSSRIHKNSEGIVVITEWDQQGNITGVRNLFDYAAYSEVEVWPYFVGGKQAFNNFLGLNVKYPYQAVASKIEGKVYVRFIVDHDGSLSGIEVIKGIGAGCDEEAMRVIRLTDMMWRPGKKGDKIVKTKMVVPISFKLAK